jgi:hypothetical protein
MSKSERYRARAEEAERLASLVSYGRDKERLIAQATELHAKADAAEASDAEPAPTPVRAPPRRRWPSWIRRLKSNAHRVLA